MEKSILIALLALGLSATTAFSQVPDTRPRPRPSLPPGARPVLAAPAPTVRPIRLPSPPQVSLRVPDTHSTYTPPPPPMPTPRPSRVVSGPRLMPAPSAAELTARREEDRRFQCLVQADALRGPAGSSSIAAPVYYRGCVDRNPWLQMAGVNAAAAISAGANYVQAQSGGASALVRR